MRSAAPAVGSAATRGPLAVGAAATVAVAALALVGGACKRRQSERALGSEAAGSGSGAPGSGSSGSGSSGSGSSGSGSPGSGSSGSGALPPGPDQISGTLTLDGAPLAVERCRPGREESIYVDLVTSAGALRFLAYDGERMFWNPRPGSAERGAPLPCTRLERSWGGATRSDGTTYFRGRLIFECRGDAGAVAGDLEVDCGRITPLERQLLDEGRRKKRDELGLPG